MLLLNNERIAIPETLFHPSDIGAGRRTGAFLPVPVPR